MAEVRVGISELFTGEHGRDQVFLRDTSQLLEGLGFSSIWLPEHVVFFPEYRDNYPYGTLGRNEVNATRGIIDPLLAAVAVGMATERVRIGSYVLVAAQRNPVLLARQIANADVLSGGRFEFGVGVGWSSQEFDALDVPFAARGARTDDVLRILRLLWTEDLAGYDSEYYSFEPLLLYPKPVQAGGPPIVVGGNSAATIRRIVEHGNGWAGYSLGLDDVARFIERLDAALTAAGRSLSEVTLRIGRRATDTTEAAWEEDARYIEGCMALGLHEVVVSPRFEVDGYERAAQRYAEIVGIQPSAANP